MVELIIPNQTNDLLNETGSENLNTVLDSSSSPRDIYFWIFDILSILHSYFEKLLNLDVLYGKIFDWIPKHSDNVSKFWLKDENRDTFGKLSHWSNF